MLAIGTKVPNHPEGYFFRHVKPPPRPDTLKADLNSRQFHLELVENQLG